MPRRPPMKTVSQEIDIFNTTATSVITTIINFCKDHEVSAENVYLDFDCEDYYGSTTHRFKIYAVVPMTKDEITAERAERRNLQELHKANAKRQLASLKENYPDEFNEVASEGGRPTP